MIFWSRQKDLGTWTSLQQWLARLLPKSSRLGKAQKAVSLWHSTAWMTLMSVHPRWEGVWQSDGMKIEMNEDRSLNFLWRYHPWSIKLVSYHVQCNVMTAWMLSPLVTSSSCLGHEIYQLSPKHHLRERQTQLHNLKAHSTLVAAAVITMGKTTKYERHFLSLQFFITKKGETQETEGLSLVLQ